MCWLLRIECDVSICTCCVGCSLLDCDDLLSQPGQLFGQPCTDTGVVAEDEPPIEQMWGLWQQGGGSFPADLVEPLWGGELSGGCKGRCCCVSLFDSGAHHRGDKLSGCIEEVDISDDHRGGCSRFCVAHGWGVWAAACIAP